MIIFKLSEMYLIVPDMLSWAKDKINVMYCVKESTDIPRAISTLIENNAQDRAFLEIGVSEILEIAVASEDWDQVYYVIEVSHKDDLNMSVFNNDSYPTKQFNISLF